MIEIDTWDALRVAPAVIRSFEAGPDGLDVICIGGRKPEGPDSERIRTSGTDRDRGRVGFRTRARR